MSWPPAAMAPAGGPAVSPGLCWSVDHPFGPGEHVEFLISVEGADPAAGSQLPGLVEALNTWIREGRLGAGARITVRTPSGETFTLAPPGTLPQPRTQGSPIPRPPDGPATSPPEYGAPAGFPRSGSARGTERHTPPGPVLQPDDDWPRETQEP